MEPFHGPIVPSFDINRYFENWSFPPTLGGNEVLYCNGMPGNLTSNGVIFTVEALIYHFRESEAHLNFSSLLYPYLFDILKELFKITHFIDHIRQYNNALAMASIGIKESRVEGKTGIKPLKVIKPNLTTHVSY